MRSAEPLLEFLKFSDKPHERFDAARHLFFRGFLEKEAIAMDHDAEPSYGWSHIAALERC